MLVDKGITKEVTKLFLNGTHTAQAVWEVMGSPTNLNRKAYIFKLVRDLRAKHGMEVVKRNANYGRKRKSKTKTGAKKPTQLALDLNAEGEPDASQEFAVALAEHLSSKAWNQPKSLVIATKQKEIDKITEEYVTLHDQHMALKKRFDEVQKEAYKFQVETFDLKAIVKYLEAKNGN